MPTRQFALERNGPKRLTIAWKGVWKELRVSLDGTELGVIEGKDSLKAGRDFALPDGSRLLVQLTKQLELRRDGRPLPGSAIDPVSILKLSYGILFFIGGGNLLVGILGMTVPDRSFREVFGWPDALVGLAFLGLAVLVKRRSSAALGVAVALLSGILLFRIVATLGALGQGAMPMGLAGIPIGIMFLLAICKGFGAIHELEAEEQEKVASASAG